MPNNDNINLVKILHGGREVAVHSARFAQRDDQGDKFSEKYALKTEISSPLNIKTLGGVSLIKSEGNDNISLKTINGQSILGTGNIEITGSGEGGGSTPSEFYPYVIVQNLPEQLNSKLFYLCRDTNNILGLYVADENGSPVRVQYSPESDTVIENIQAQLDSISTASAENTGKLDALSAQVNSLNIPESVSDLQDGSEYCKTSKMQEYVETAVAGNFASVNCDTDQVYIPGRYTLPTGKSLLVDKVHDGIRQEIDSDESVQIRILKEKTVEVGDTLVIKKYDSTTDIEDTSFTMPTAEAGEAYELAPGYKYVLSGKSTRGIKITKATVDYDTVLILNGVEFTTTKKTINFKPVDSSCIIELADESENILWNMQAEDATETDGDGVIISDNNLYIYGNGSLLINSNTGMHGIKGKKVIIGGKPNILIHALHDGIHGTKLVHIQSGKVSLINCHNGIDSSNSDYTSGKVMITGGELFVEGCDVGIKQTHYNLMRDNGIICNKTKLTIIGSTELDLENVFVLEDAESTLAKVSFEEFYGLAEVYDGYEIEDTLTGEKSIIYNNLENSLLPNNVTNRYDITFSTTLGDEDVILVSGYIDKPLNVIGRKVQVILHNAFVKAGLEGPAILTNDDLRLVLDDETVSYVHNVCGLETNAVFDYQKDYDAVKSGDDIRIKNDGCVIVSSHYGDGLDGTKIEITDNGTVYCHDCGECGIKGTVLYIGGKDDKAYSNCKAVIYANENAKNLNKNMYTVPSADVYARNGKSKKGQYYIAQTYKGHIYTDTFKSIEKDNSELAISSGYAQVVNDIWVYATNNEFALHHPIYYTNENIDDEVHYDKSTVYETDNLGGTSKFVLYNKTLSLYEGNWVVYKKLSEYTPYNTLKKLSDYLYYMEYSDVDADFAADYIRDNYTPLVHGCSSVRKGNFYGRNFDWYYSDGAAFIINMPATKERHASIGVNDYSSILTKQFVESGICADIYKVLPYLIVDGINDAGVVVNENVVPNGLGGKGDIGTRNATDEERETISCVQLLRYILDNFASAKEAVEYVDKYVTLTQTSLLNELGYTTHFMIADGTNTYVLEFIETDGGETVLSVIDLDDQEDSNMVAKAMTNFHLTGVEFNEDGKVYTPATQDATLAVGSTGIIDWGNEDGKDYWYTYTSNAQAHNNITSFGSGLERYNIAVDESENIESKEDMVELMKKLAYTHAYDLDTYEWYTEFVGSYFNPGDTVPITVYTPKSQFEKYNYSQRVKDYVANAKRGDKKKWITTHTSVFDIAKKTMTVFSQEDYTKHYDFKVTCPVIPLCPKTDGEYSLKASVVDGNITYSWIKEEN